MGHAFRIGARVSWDWGQGRGYGHIKAAYTHRVIKEIDGVDVIRHGSQEDPAYLIEDDHGHEVLKLQSELRLED